jgi:HEAT repeat protein
MDVPPTIEGAIELLKSPDTQIRQFVAYLLGEAKHPAAIEPLIVALRDSNVGVRGAAANALGKIGDVRALPPLRLLMADKNPQMVVWAAFALTRLGEDHFDWLIGALRSPDVMVRRSAVLALNQLGDQRAIPALTLLLEDREKRFDSDNTVAEAVEHALAALGHRVG